MSISLPQRRLVSQEDAAVIEGAQVPRSEFHGSWTRKTTFNAGQLVPFMCNEVLPGDHLSYDVTAYVRMATPLFPLFDNQRVDTFFFFVPMRLVWENSARFFGEQDSPNDSIDYTIPVVNVGESNTLGSLFDQFALPRNATDGFPKDYEVNALPLRGYNLIWNQWFRDQNLQDSIVVNKGNGPDVASNYVVRYRAKSHDYFTSCLPWPQKFTPPSIPLSGQIPVRGIGAVQAANPGAALGSVKETGGYVVTYPFYHGASAPAAGISVRMSTNDAGSAFPMVFADLAEVTGVQLQTFRHAFMVQSLLERDARGGTRYGELIRSHFGVTNPDARIGRPEYIGGGQSPLQLTPIAQTAPTVGAPVGALGAAGTAVGQHRASYAATEHGYIIGLINVKTEISYQQTMHKMWKRRTRFDFYWPALAQLGEQAVTKGELHFLASDATDNLVFGYQERWHEYRTHYSEVTGLFRSSQPGTLDAWHLAQKFNGTPTLGNAFIIDNPPMARVLAAGEQADNQQYLADILITRRAVRPIPTFGTPAILGRF